MEAKRVASADRLSSLLPGLKFSRRTHVQWRDCDQKFRDENPDIGSSKFHAEAIKEYDERISTIEEAIGLLKTI